MHQQSIPATLVRLFAIALILYAFRNANMAMLFLTEERSEISNAYMLLSGITVPAILACLLWIAPAKAVGLSRADAKGAGSAALDPQELFRVGVALMGLYLFVTASAFLFDWLLTYTWQKDLARDYGSSISPDYIQLLSEVFLLVLGLVFFFGSSAVAKLFSLARSFGVESARSSDKTFKQTPDEARSTEADHPGRGTG